MQELYCHACDKYVQFETPDDIHARVSLACPNCGHMHYRVVRNGRITSDRWASGNRSLAVFQISYRQTSYSVASSSDSSSGVMRMRSYGTTASSGNAYTVSSGTAYSVIASST